MLAANINRPFRLSYSLVEDTVNVASRLQGANKQHASRIIISAETQPTTSLKGKNDPVSLFGV